MAKRTKPDYDTTITPAQVLSKAVEVLGPNGEHWIRHKLTDGAGSYCMLGAMNQARKELNATPATNDRAKRIAARVIRIISEPYAYAGETATDTVAFFNDTRAKASFQEIKNVMCSAVKTALSTDTENNDGTTTKA